MDSSERRTLARSLGDSLEIIGNLAFLVRHETGHSEATIRYLEVMDGEIRRMRVVLKLHLAERLPN